MFALTILLLGLVVISIMVTILFVIWGMTNLLVLVIPLIPLLALIGSGLLGMIELLLLFGEPEDRKTAKTDLAYLGITFVASGILWWLMTRFLLNL
ncbi:MAG: hypothetical protein ABFD64_04015 [Armatimonadota bacterium]